MHRRWLSLPLLSSCVSAFYPYSGGSAEGKRSVPFEKPRALDDGTVKVDIHRVEKRDNVFPVVISNTPTESNALAVHQDGNDYSYFSVVKFGSKAQPMYMLIDTGSANTWVFSSDCKSKSCGMHNTFGKEDSSTLKTAPTNWTLAYGTGEVDGIIGSDTVAFAEYSFNMGFGLATIASDDFNNYPMDGILGLGRPKSNNLGTPTLMEVLDKEANLKSNVIGVHLHRGSDNTKDGEIIFGDIDTSKFSGSISYTDASNDESWEIPVQDAVVDGTACNFKGKSAVVDTGTTYILMPPSDADLLHSKISGSKHNGESFTVPCDTTAKLEIKISDKLYSILPKDYVGKATGNVCSSNIIGHQAFGQDQWILGDVFLKNVYAVFDFDKARIGFGMPGSGGSANEDKDPNTSNTVSTTMAPSASATSSTTTSRASSEPTSGSDGTPFGMGSDSQSSNSSRELPQILLALSAAFLVGFIL